MIRGTGGVARKQGGTAAEIEIEIEPELEPEPETAEIPMRWLALFETDLRAKALWLYEDAGPRARLKALLTDGTAAMFLYRAMQGARRWRLTPLEMICNKLLVIFGQCVIGRGAEFGPGFVLIHSLGVVINGNVRGGARVHIEHQVTIGAEKRRSPLIGDDVFIGAGAKILGGVAIGSGARVGANAVVLEDVPANATVVGIPARVVKIRGKGGGTDLGADFDSETGSDSERDPDRPPAGAPPGSATS